MGANAGGSGGYTLTTPLAGIVTRRRATVGRLVGVEETLFEVVDVSSMWAELDVPETDLPDVSLKQPVVIEIDGLEGRELKGEVTYVAPAIQNLRSPSERGRAHRGVAPHRPTSVCAPIELRSLPTERITRQPT